MSGYACSSEASGKFSMVQTTLVAVPALVRPYSSAPVIGQLCPSYLAVGYTEVNLSLNKKSDGWLGQDIAMVSVF